MNGHAACLAADDFGGGESCQPVCNTGYAHCVGQIEDCETHVASDPENCGNCGVSCNGGTCTNGVCDVDGGTGPEAIVTGLDGPTALTTDGVEIFFVDDGVLSRADVDGTSPTPLAFGVGVVGNIETDGTYVYWSGTWSNESADAGSGDSGDDAGEDSGIDGSAIAIQSGIFRVLAIDGQVEQVATIDALPTLSTDGFSIFARARSGDAGLSTLGNLPLFSDAGFTPFASLSGNTENMHAFAVAPDHVVALDDVAIVSVPLDGGAKTLIEVPDAATNALFSTTGGVVDVQSSDASFTLHAIGSPSTNVGGGTAVVGAIGAHNGVIVVADRVSGVLYRYLAGSLEVPGVPVATSPYSSIDFVAVDDTFAYWTTKNAIYRASLPLQ